LLAAVCASVLLVGAGASADYYQCYQAGHCSPALSSPDECEEGRDYDVAVTNAGSGVTVLSFHGGKIERHTSVISSELARLYGWNRYDFDAHATAQCLTGTHDNDFKKLHITSTKFDDPRAVALVAAHPKAVAIHGHGRSYSKGAICVGGKDAAARNAFRNYVEDNAAAWSADELKAIDVFTAPSGTDCGAVELRGESEANLVNRTSSRAGLQLELHLDLRADLANTSSAYNDLRRIVYGAIRQAMDVPTSCLTVDNGGATWRNRALASNQTGRFTAEIGATPQGSNTDAGVGLSNGPQTAYSGLACAVRFYQGHIQARNGGVYEALSAITYSPHQTYRFRFDVNVPAHTYSVYVTPPGGDEQEVGRDYVFRTEQAAVGSLNNWSLFSDSGAMRGCGFAAPSYTAGVGGPWINNPFAAQGGTFTAEWDATPLEAGIDAVVGLSNGAQTSFPGFASLVRFNTSDKIDARDGGIYRAASAIPYAPHVSYHFRLTVNVPAHTYSVYVTPAGGTEQVVGLNYAFRTEQSSVASLNSYGLIVDSAAGSARVSNFAVSSSHTLFQDGFNGADGLITNEYAHWNSDGILSPDWDMTSGTLFRQGNTAWTGAPDSAAPNKFSSDHTNSDAFRLNTRRSFAGNIKVSLALRNNSDIHDSNCGGTNDTCWHGVHIWLRHLTQYDLYYVSLNRADNKVVIKRKVPCGTENGGTYFVLKQNGIPAIVTRAWSAGVWQHFSATIQTNSNGSVTIKVYDDDSDPNTPFLQATDGGGTNTGWSSVCGTPGSYPTSQYPPLTAAGSVGVRGDFDNFNVDDMRVSSF
jgi:phage replication-related protein YjqB (UPF0714/DUF867 family)